MTLGGSATAPPPVTLMIACTSCVTMSEEKRGAAASALTIEERLSVGKHTMRRLQALAAHIGSTETAAGQAESEPAQSLTEEQARGFLEQGFLIIPSFLRPSRLEAVRDAVERRVDAEGAMGGWEGGHSGVARRLCNLVAKHELFAEIAAEPMLLEGAKLAIGRDDFILHVMNVHDPALAMDRVQAGAKLSVIM